MSSKQKVISISAPSGTDLAKRMSNFLNNINEELHPIAGYYFIKKIAVSISCYTIDSEHYCILIYEEQVKL